MAQKCPTCETINPADSKFCKECAAPLPPYARDQASFTRTLETAADELTRGTLFAGRYEIIEELGAGGMGRVYRAFDKQLDEEIALKFLRPEIAADKRTVERFRNEIKIARKITHPNVCRTHDLGEDGKTLYITMEYVRGEDLKSLIRRTGQLTAGKAVLIAGQVAEGLAQAHRLGVVHRDLKPQNVMIDQDGNAKIMDFGIARSLLGGGITGEGAIIGTPEYMSPEQVEGKPADARADIYALGIILFEMVTGRVPFEGETPFSIANKHKTEPPPIPKKLAPQIPEGLSKLILRCLEKEREKRYQTAEGLLADLALVELALPITDRVSPKAKARTRTPHEIAMKIPSKRFLIPAAALVALGAALLVFWPVAEPQKATPAGSPKPSLAIPYFENISQDPNLDWWRVGLPELLIRGLSQSRLMRVLRRDEIDDILKELNLIEAKKYSMSDMKSITKRGGVKTVLNGSYMKAGDGIEITAYLINPGTGETLQPIWIKAELDEEITVKVDELIREIKAGLGFGADQISKDAGLPVGQISTKSPEAIRLLIKSQDLFDKYEFNRSLELDKKAIEIDPEFAGAWGHLAWNYFRLGRWREYREANEKALTLSGRLPDSERLVMESSYYLQWERTYDKSLRASEELLQLLPEELELYINIQTVYLFLEEWEQVIAVSQNYLKNGGMFAFGHGNLAWAFGAVGVYNEARRICDEYLKHDPGQTTILLEHAMSHLWEGHLDKALNEWGKLPADFRSNVDPLDIGIQIFALMGDFESALKECSKRPGKDDPETRWGFLRQLYYLCLFEGKFTESTRHIKEAIGLAGKTRNAMSEVTMRLSLAELYLRLSNYREALIESGEALRISLDIDSAQGERRALACRGAASIGLRQMDEAKSVAAKLDKVISEGLNKKSRRLLLRLNGQINLEEGNYASAIDLFKKAVALLPYQNEMPNPHAEFLEPLATAYYRSGDLDRAGEEYERITLLSVGRFAYGDIYAKAFYMLGKIAEQQGDKVRAREKYQKFLELWKNADPGLPEVEDARKRLAALS